MFRTMKTNLNAHPLFVYTEEHIKGHLKIVCLKLNVLRLLHLDMYKVIGKTEDIEKLDDEDLDYEWLTLNEILDTLRDINLMELKVEEEFFVPSLTRTKLKEKLRKTYEIALSKSLIRGKILRKFKLFATKIFK